MGAPAFAHGIDGRLHVDGARLMAEPRILALGKLACADVNLLAVVPFPVADGEGCGLRPDRILRLQPALLVLKSGGEHCVEALSDPLQTIVEAIKTTLEKTPPELSADIIDRGIMLTGGGALLRGIDLLVMQQTGMPVHIAKRPLDCVVDGAGKRLSKAMGIQYKHNRR